MKSTSVKSKGPHLADSFDDSPIYSWEFLTNVGLVPSQVTNKNPHIQPPEKKLVERIFWSTLDDLRASFRISTIKHFKSKRQRYQVDRHQNKKRAWRTEAMEWIYSARVDRLALENYGLDDPRYTFYDACEYMGIESPEAARLSLEVYCLQWSHTNGAWPVLFDSPSHDGEGGETLRKMNTVRSTKTELSNRNDRERKRRLIRNGYRIEKAIHCCVTQ